ncbi:sigma-70 family RNA polymerase sigma factor [Leifsonia sp. NPDC058230]|uniref:sigma-70 family RNA polymerase sigma factor n=1 Tax=Leifsonia sp. NPDC058230 TaxID=3346391 RepID=UPI0036DDF252
MNDPRPNQSVSDGTLVERARAGDASAYGELWVRHAQAGRAAAKSITSSIDPDELVSEAFTRIWETTKRGAGPTKGFRPYLIVTIRNLAARLGAKVREAPIDFADDLPDESTLDAEADRALDRGMSAKAFATLPARWQEVLWYSEVEEYDPATVGKLMGISPAAAAMLSFRAREGLRRAWVQVHIASSGDDPAHSWTIERLGARTRGTLTKRDRDRIEAHLAECEACTALASEAENINSRLALVLLPLALGAVGSLGYLAAIRNGDLRLADTAAAVPMSSDPVVSALDWGASLGSSLSLVSPKLLTGLTAGAIVATIAAGASTWDHRGQSQASVSSIEHEPRDQGSPPSGDPTSSEPSHPSIQGSERPPTEQTLVTAGELSVSIDNGPDRTFFPILSGAGPASAVVIVRDGSVELSRVQADDKGRWSTGQIESTARELEVHLQADRSTAIRVPNHVASPTLEVRLFDTHTSVSVVGVPGAHFQLRTRSDADVLASRLDATGEWRSDFAVRAFDASLSGRYAVGTRAGPWVHSDSTPIKDSE